MAGEAAAQARRGQSVIAHGHELGHMPMLLSGQGLGMLKGQECVVAIILQQGLPPAPRIYGKRDASIAVEPDRGYTRYSLILSIRQSPLLPILLCRKLFRSRFESRM